MSSSSASATSSQHPPEKAACPDNPHRVLVIGANGQTGSRIIRLLANDADEKHYQPVAMIRDHSQGSTLSSMNVPWFVGDLERGQPTVDEMEGIRTVIFAAGAGRHRANEKKVTIDYLGAVRAAVAAQQTASVKRFILLSGINTDPMGTRRSEGASDLSGPLAAWHRLKSHSETYVKEMHLHGRPLEWIILCPGRLVDDGSRRAGLVKCSLIHGEDDLRESLTDVEKKASLRSLPRSHDGKNERLCVTRDNVAATIVALIDASAESVVGKSITVVDGILPV
eukprot:CAMPEP_0172490294 /NCGR_PEP_ID=MMETSP1066-20121228/20659_1 /TAXON_ID=671091 /ORGANISM="Coscinodiscus wailesii, Strain CCMP2513" /LENGTH=280 /DNA_ID=CAMNT_0013258685 /DNA_START=51 /DNA_END=890 /DNA_ORIENTATION=+